MIPVMIVEDEFLVRVGLQSMIEWEKYGFRIVAEAPNGERALELYRIHRPQLILTDIRMSPMDGLELMGRIRELDAHVKFIVISAYSEFEYAQQAIRHGVELYLDKSCFTAEDLDPVLHRIAGQCREQNSSDPPRISAAVSDIMDGLPPANDHKALERWFEQNHLLNVPKVVAACRLDRSEESRVGQGVLAAMAKDILEKEPLAVQTFARGRFLVLLIGCAESERIESALMHLSKTVEQYFSIALYCGVSARFTQPFYVFQALSDACKTCNNFLFDKSTRLRTYQREIPDSGFDKKLIRICDEIQFQLYAADREKVSSLIADALDAARNYRMLERVVFSIIMSLERFDRSILVSAAFEEVMSDDLAEIRRALTGWAHKLCGHRREPAERDTIEEIIDYIREHLQDDISLVRLAEMYYFSPNYLGQLFRQKTGIYYNTYVANLRINRACELLLNTDDSVGSIAQLVGVEDPHYFSKMFKDRMGVSPNKYRRMWNA